MLPQKRIMRCVETIFKGFWKWHIDNIGLMVCSLLKSQQVGVASIGRELLIQTSPKHAIKRVDRFLSNDKLPLVEMISTYIRYVVGSRSQIGICIDWTKIRDWPVLVASLVYKGRSIPLFWAVMQPTLLNKSVNAFEYGFLTLLSQLLPKGVKAILLFDRGFHRVELCRFLERLGFYYVIRSGGTTWTSHPRYEGYMGNCIRRRGKIIDLPQALLRKERPLISRVVGVWATNQKEAWILVTNLDDNAATVIRWYGRRFQIEEMFRDQKSHRFGLGLGQLKMFDPDRLERLLLIVVFAHFLAMAIGALARAQGKDRSFAANSGKNITQFSDFYLGKFYIWRLPWPPIRTISLFLQCSEKLRG